MKNTATPTEQELVRQSLQGDVGAQRCLYGRYVGAMFHTIFRMVANREDAEDLTQEVFVKVFRQLGSYRGEATLGAWIKRIAVNAALNFLRQSKRIRWVEMENHNQPDDGPEIDETAWSHDIRRVHEAIKGLPDGCRLVFSLYMLEGFPHKEVGKMMGITESTSKTQYRRAKRLLREALSQDI